MASHPVRIVVKQTSALVRARPCGERGRPPTPPASSSSRRASCARARSGRWPRQAGIGPGVSVLDLCCGVAGPGRFIAREPGCAYLGVDQSRPRIEHRPRAGRRPALSLRGRARIPPLPAGRSTWCSCSRRCSRSPTRSRCCGGSPRALAARRAVRLHAGGGRAAHGGRAAAHARRRHGLAHPARRDARRCERVGLVVRWQEDCSASHRAVAER